MTSVSNAEKKKKNKGIAETTLCGAGDSGNGRNKNSNSSRAMTLATRRLLNLRDHNPYLPQPIQDMIPLTLNCIACIALHIYCGGQNGDLGGTSVLSASSVHPLSFMLQHVNLIVAMPHSSANCVWSSSVDSSYFSNPTIMSRSASSRLRNGSERLALGKFNCCQLQTRGSCV